MFENIGSALISCVSKFAPDDTDVVSSTGATPVTVTCSLMLPTSSVNGSVDLLADGQRHAVARDRLEARHLDDDPVSARLQQRRFEVAGVVGHEHLSGVRVDVGNLDSRSWDDPLRVLDGP